MPTNKKQLKRMVRFVAALRKEQYPNRSTFVKKLREYDLENNENIACSEKTIQRDIKALIEEFGAPIEYDFDNKGYFLTRSDWKFRCPSFQDDELLALAIGACVAEKIFPAPISTNIEDAFNYQLTENNYDGGFDHLSQLMVSSGLNVTISPDIFNTMYTAWKDRYCVKITYSPAKGAPSERIIEPQILAFHNRAWIAKSYCREKLSARNFAVHRIQTAELTDERFKYRPEFLHDVETGNLYNFKQITDVKIHCEETVLRYIVEQPLHKDQQIEETKNGFILTIPEIMEEELIRWVMTQCGYVSVLEPIHIRKRIAETAQELLKNHQD